MGNSGLASCPYAATSQIAVRLGLVLRGVFLVGFAYAGAGGIGGGDPPPDARRTRRTPPN